MKESRRINRGAISSPTIHCVNVGVPTETSGQLVIKMGYVYFLKSKKNGEYYIGSSRDPVLRLRHHNLGRVKSIKFKRPFILVFQQEFDNMKTAQKIEFKIKRWKRRDFIDKIIQDGKIKIE